jgi:uncharacterized membrane protein YraQ (UPF0718 family)
MSFWIASPSMDPEAFFLSVAAIGWELAVWRLASTLVLSLGAGLVTHFIAKQGWLGQHVLRIQQTTSAQSTWAILKEGWQRLRRRLVVSPSLRAITGSAALSPAVACCGAAQVSLTDNWQPAIAATPATTPASSCGSDRDTAQGSSCSAEPTSFWRRLLTETWSATLMVVKFMALAFFLEALITLYIPSQWIAGLVGRQNPWAIVTAALFGVPAYTSNLAALPLISGLLAQGMNPAAALAFLISGPTTTLPAMSAVWGLASRRVFILYVSFSLVGAIVLGYSYALVTGLF